MGIVSLIKYEGNNQTFVWKHPEEDFNTLSQLVVHESQEALLFMNGQALDLFGPGRHTLHTQNIPLLNKIVNLPTDGESPFHCEVYFINKTEQMPIGWGVGNLNYRDPNYNDYAFVIGANGSMNIRISDSRKLITKIVGTECIFNQDILSKYFKDAITTHIKSMLPNILRNWKIDIYDIESHLVEYAKILREKISEEMADYGISLEKFNINSIAKPETDPYYQKLREQRVRKITIQNEGELKLQETELERQREVLAYSGKVEKDRMDVLTQRFEQENLGYTYQDKRRFDVMEKAAQNEGAGSAMMNTGMGLGMGVELGGAFGRSMSDIAGQSMGTYGTSTPVAAVGVQQGARGSSLEEFKERIEKLKMLFEAGMITEERYNADVEALRQECMGG